MQRQTPENAKYERDEDKVSRSEPHPSNPVATEEEEVLVSSRGRAPSEF
jgi:hypothetical protein